MKRRLLLDTWSNPRGVVFDGSTSYAELTRPAALASWTAWSVSLWAMFPSVPGSEPVLNLFGGATATSGWTVDKAGTSLTYALRSHFAGAGTKTIFTSPYTITAGQWAHLLLSYDGSIVRGYLNGSALATTHAVSSELLNWGSDSALRLARRASTYAAVALDELSLWDHAVTPAQVRQASTGRPRDLGGQAGLGYWWRLGDRFVSGINQLPAVQPGAPAWTWTNGNPATQLITGA